MGGHNIHQARFSLDTQYNSKLFLEIVQANLKEAWKITIVQWKCL